MAKDFRESALVVVKELLAFVVHTTNVDDNRAGVEKGRVSCPFQVSRGVCLCEAQQVDCECFIAVKCAVVRTDDLQTTNV